MNKDIDDLKTRLREKSHRASEAERALGLIEDVAASIAGAGVLKPMLVVAGGEVMLCVQLEDPVDPPKDFGEVADLAMIDPQFIGVVLDGLNGDEVIEFTPDMSEIKGLEADNASPVKAPPEPEVQDAPVKNSDGAPKQKVARKAAKPRSVTEAELVQIDELWQRGDTIAQIARAIKATNPKWVNNVINRNRDRYPVRKIRKAGKSVSGKAKPKAAPDKTPAARRIFPELGAGIHFTPQQDLKLAIHMQAGAGIGGAAALLRIKRDLCQARWNELLPEKTPEAIEALIERLKNTDCAKVAP